MSDGDERIEKGTTRPEVDVQGQQAEADWGEEPSSDEELDPEVRRRLGLGGTKR